MHLLVESKLIFLWGCNSIKIINNNALNLAGEYKLKRGYEKLELKTDSTYIIWRGENPHLNTYWCDYSSMGKWRSIGQETIELLSENYYTQQKGFEYKLSLDNKYSQDSLYIDIKLPEEFLTVYGNNYISFYINFNYGTNHSIEEKDTVIKIKKSEYLLQNDNNILLYLNADISGTVNDKSRNSYKIFEKKLDTNKYNYLSIELPYFDNCFFEFVSYNHELLYIKNKSTLVWRGEEWIRQ